jgi:hypothetical protein
MPFKSILIKDFTQHKMFMISTYINEMKIFPNNRSVLATRVRIGIVSQNERCDDDVSQNERGSIHKRFIMMLEIDSIETSSLRLSFTGYLSDDLLPGIQNHAGGRCLSVDKIPFENYRDYYFF